MIVYLDTSALAKHYLEEEGSQQMRSFLAQVTHRETSALTELELTSFLERAKRDSRVRSPFYRKCLSQIDQDFHGEAIAIISIGRVILRKARRVIRQRNLRAGDSIQLATAISTHTRFSGEMTFASADQRLLEAARLEGMKCFNPLVD